MEKGIRQEIISGKPARAESIEEREARETAILKERAKFFKIFETAEGQLVIREIENLLMNRIQALIQGDAEAKAYKDVLTTLGYKADAASKAVKLMILRLNPKEEAM